MLLNKLKLDLPVLFLSARNSGRNLRLRISGLSVNTSRLALPKILFINHHPLCNPYHLCSQWILIINIHPLIWIHMDSRCLTKGKWDTCLWINLNSQSTCNTRIIPMGKECLFKINGMGRHLFHQIKWLWQIRCLIMVLDQTHTDIILQCITTFHK
jgi:hypothetical protein